MIEIFQFTNNLDIFLPLNLYTFIMHTSFDICTIFEEQYTKIEKLQMNRINILSKANFIRLCGCNTIQLMQDKIIFRIISNKFF